MQTDTDIGFSFEQMMAVISATDDALVTPYAFTRPAFAERAGIERGLAKRRCDLMESQGLIRKDLITVRDGWGRLLKRRPGYVLTEKGKKLLSMNGKQKEGGIK